MAGSIQAAQAVADIRAGMAVAEDPAFDQLVRAGERDARGGSGQGGEAFAGDDDGQGSQAGEGRQERPRQPMPMAAPEHGDDPLTDLRGPSAYAPAPPLPVGFAEFPVAPRAGRSRTGRRGLAGTGMTITGMQQTPILRADPASPSASPSRNWQTGHDWNADPRVRGAIDFAGFHAPARHGAGTAGIHPDPMERFADAGRRRRDALDMLFERFEGISAPRQSSSEASRGALPASHAAPGLRIETRSRN